MPRKFIFGDKAVVAHNRAGKAVNIAPAMNLAGGTVNIMIWGEISEWWGVNSRDVYWALKGQNVSQINVFISSPGGEIDQAFVIHDMLKGHPANVTAYLVGQCASAATIISCSADEVVMSNQCIYMIHKPQWICWGDADAMGKAEEILNKYQSLIVNVYKRKTGMDEDALNDLINEETWFEPTEALALGFVDKVVDSIEVDFLLPATGTETANPKEDYYLEDASTYRVAAMAALEKGMHPFNKADIRKYSRKSTNTMFGKDFFQNILDVLNGKKALAKNANIEELAQDLADDEDLAGELQNDAIADAVKAEVAKVKPAALTMESLVALVEKAGDDDKAKIAAALNIKPAAAKKPKGEGEGEESEEEPGEDDEQEAYGALNKKFEELQAEFANLKKGGSATAPTNGKPPLKPKKDEGEPGKVSDGQLKIANDSFAKGYITAEVYEKITGQKPPARKKG